MATPHINFGTVGGMAVGAILIGIVPTLLLDWFDVWPHFPALLIALLGAAAIFLKESPSSEFAGKLQRENRSTGIGFLAGAAALIPIGAWVADDASDDAAPRVQVEAEQQAVQEEASTGMSMLEAEVDTDIDELLEVYSRNQIEGLQRFGSVTLKVSGEVVRVREALGTGIVIMRSPQTGAVMEIGFSQSGTPKTGALKPGDSVIVTCPGASEALGQIFLSNCSDVERII